ncbi:hypothetical protein KGF54_000808 [Candida jiufengensis]|uniref:uncharacterized protein n=1 Tax=Candida jiufengensis TaxID=497108 RepID=UPI002224F803|nr:uncharacterized protein KGF54_000808 [Candida jiufengensis]KAI5956333.1 hypothetical protein KGF54_000808 [Candida jiufengensis]
MKDFDRKLQNLLKWINDDDAENGQKTSTISTSSLNQSYVSPALKVKDVSGSGRGIYTTTSLNSNFKIIKVPHKYLLNFKTVLTHLSKYMNQQNSSIDDDEITKIYKAFTRDEILKLTSFQLLSLYITLEKQRGTNSFWKPFLDSLPSEEDFLYLPIYYPDDILKLLPYTTKQHASKVKSRFEKDYETVISLLRSKNVDNQVITKLIPKSKFLLSWLSINSRCLYMDLPTSHTPEDNFTLAPYIDFINHSDNEQCVMKIDPSGFHVSTTTNYKEDDQIFFNYGPHSNEFLLCEYGFIIPNNKWDDINISKQLIEKLSNLQIEFLKEQNYFDNYTFTSTGLSFRTEVCLAILQEKDPKESRKLRALINGNIDSEVYKRGSNQIMKSILNDIRQESNSKQYLEFANNDDGEDNKLRKQLIGTIYKNRYNLASTYLNSID